MSQHKAFWVLEHVNAQMFIGRFDGYWTRTHDLDAAALWHSKAEAENALSALLQEAADRVGRSKEQWPAQMWWDMSGGLVVVSEVEQITRVRERVAEP